MWDTFMELVPSKIVWFCAAISFVVPYLIHKVNNKVHQIVDPPWKKDE